MADLGTYLTTELAQTPFKLLPEPGDIITRDWIDCVSLFSQRYMKVATTIATVANNANSIFDYSSLRCDFHPPFLEAYYYDTVDTAFARLYHIGNDQYLEFSEVGLGSAKFYQLTGATRAFFLLAYM